MTLPTNPIPDSTGAGTKNGVASEAQGRALSDESEKPYYQPKHERVAFEKWYVENAFDYPNNPIGSENCSKAWVGWKARALTATPTDAAPAAQDLQALLDAQAFDNAGPPYTLDGMDPRLRGLIVNAVHGAMATEAPPPAGHWLTSSWQLGRGIAEEIARAALTQSAPLAAPQDAALSTSTQGAAP